MLGFTVLEEDMVMHHFLCGGVICLADHRPVDLEAWERAYFVRNALLWVDEAWPCQLSLKRGGLMRRSRRH